ncbi:DUF4158 domain-containing protein [Amycolatopsis sp. NPDC051372]|uniref:DUF4158 domain-containing protein n=1 Tax=unclassified Amycolatopsis TaxID=2618356 RepID=UPI003435294B
MCPSLIVSGGWCRVFTRFFSDAEIRRLRSEELGRDELIRHFTLGADDRACLESSARGTGNRLRVAIQLCTLPWLGFVPEDIAAVRRDHIRTVHHGAAHDGCLPNRHRPDPHRRQRRHRLHSVNPSTAGGPARSSACAGPPVLLISLPGRQ